MKTLDVLRLSLLLALLAGACGDENSVAPDDPDPPDPPDPPVPTIPRYEVRPAFATGAGFGCQLRGSSSVCWGFNSVGQFGNGGTSTDWTYPTDPGWGLDFELLTAGNDFLCGLTGDGEGYCWGFNPQGLGVGAGPGPIASPTRLPVSERWTYLEALGRSACGVTESGDGYCWGTNSRGELGDSTTVDRDEPALVAGGHTWLMISPGAFHSCGVDVDAGLWCWGSNASGQLGLGTEGEDIPWPTAVEPSRRWASVSAGQSKTCAITEAGEAWCWGYGGLGNGSEGGSASPVQVSGGHEWAFLRSGLGACGVTTAGDAYCWGRAGSGQVGSGTVYDDPLDEEPVPMAVAGGQRWTTLDIPTLAAFCGETTSADVLCWGRISPTQLLCSSPAWAPEPLLGSEEEGDPCVLRIATSGLPTAVRDSTYADSLEALGGGGGPYTWTLVGGTLPDGVALVSRDGFAVFEGEPTETGQFVSRIRVTAGEASDEADVLLRVNACQRLWWDDFDPPVAKVGTAYSYQLEAKGGDGAFTWTVADDTSPPPGLDLSLDGLLSGTPTAAGTFDLFVVLEAPNCDSRVTIRIVLVVET